MTVYCSFFEILVFFVFLSKVGDTTYLYPIPSAVTVHSCLCIYAWK